MVKLFPSRHSTATTQNMILRSWLTYSSGVVVGVRSVQSGVVYNRAALLDQSGDRKVQCSTLIGHCFLN